MSTALPAGPRLPRMVQALGWWNRPVAFLEALRARHGRRFTIRLPGQVPFVILSDPDEVREVFTAPPDVLHPGEGASILEPTVGRHSVILLDEGPHLEQRKLLLPAFHGERMQALSGLVEAVAEQEIGRWPAGQPVALHPRLQALTLEVILRAVFGLEEGQRLDLLRDRLTRILELGSRPAAAIPWLRRDLGPRSSWGRFVALREEADALLFELIDERRANDADGDDVLAMLLAARHEDGSPMHARELRDELMTLLVAGHETTASALAWSFERLAREPAVADRLTGEIDAGAGDAYLTATLQEVLRRRPVLPTAAPRLTKRPVTIGGWTYPPDVCLVSSAYLIHHDRRVYDEPYAFRPERFLGQAPGTYTWIPFGGGRRRCLGASFAMLEMKTVVRAVLARHGVRPGRPGPELTRRRSITFSPRAGAPTVLQPRAPVAA